jgi:hypothetical protein
MGRHSSLRRLGLLNQQLHQAPSDAPQPYTNPLQVAAAAGAPADTVKSYELFKVPPRWLFLRVETENGVVGWGEPNIEGYSDTVGAAVTEMMGSVIGQDPSRISYIWQKLFRQKFYGAHTSQSRRQCRLLRVGPPVPWSQPLPLTSACACAICTLDYFQLAARS